MHIALTDTHIHTYIHTGCPKSNCADAHFDAALPLKPFQTRATLAIRDTMPRLQRGNATESFSCASRTIRAGKLRYRSDSARTQFRICYLSTLRQSIQNEQRLRAHDRASLGIRRVVERAKFPKALIVWAAASKMGKLNWKILPTVTRTTGGVNQWIVRERIVAELRRVCRNRQYIFHQGGVLAHRAGDKQMLCRVLAGDFMPKELWPPNSPELNPLAYGI